ncbi:MAG: LysM peptidoglycan-binding domain-containing protein, partial [Bacteroidota bacterium]
MENRVTYTVRKGDSFYDIAQMFRVNVVELRTFNGLGNYKIQVGQELRIPKSQAERDEEAESEAFAELAPERIHVVTTGDSLFQLAERYGVTINDIRRTNQL